MALILVIEDDEQYRNMLRHILEREGHEVMDASNGMEGIRAFKERPADLIITDIIMPNKGGVETIEELRRDFPDVKIIAISGGGKGKPEEYLKLAKEAGANRTLKKTFEWEGLIETIQELLTGINSE